MITCRDVCENATKYLEEETSLVQHINLYWHLVVCKKYRRFLRQFRMLVGLAANIERAERPDDEEIDALVRKLTERAGG